MPPIPYFAADLSIQPSSLDLMAFFFHILLVAWGAWYLGRTRADREVAIARAQAAMWEAHHGRAIKRAQEAEDGRQYWMREALGRNDDVYPPNPKDHRAGAAGSGASDC